MCHPHTAEMAARHHTALIGGKQAFIHTPVGTTRHLKLDAQVAVVASFHGNGHIHQSEGQSLGSFLLVWV